MTLYSVMESVKSEISVILIFYDISTNYRGGNIYVDQRKAPASLDLRTGSRYLLTALYPDLG